MKEYLLLLRTDITTKEAQQSPKQMELHMVDWMEWVDYISEKGQLVDGGNHLSFSGKVIRPNNVITDEPYSVNQESVSGYIIIRAKDLDEAARIARKCPILQGPGTSVEVRENIPFPEH
ncbi:MAG: YciI family protein [Bacteroidota bacterium]|nr:YciI family protein [Bacteroidota bacterium]